MATVDVKCRFCNQPDDVKNMVKVTDISSAIVVSSAEKLSSLSTFIVLVGLASKNRLLILL